jgi:hypothetical protein
MPTLNEHSSEETAATEGIFNVHRRGAHWTRDLGFNVPIRRTHKIIMTSWWLLLCTCHPTQEITCHLQTQIKSYLHIYQQKLFTLPMLIVITQPGKRLFLPLWSTWYFRFQPGWIMYMHQLFILLVYNLSNPRFQVGHTLSRSVHHFVGICIFRRLSPLLSLLKYFLRIASSRRTTQGLSLHQVSILLQ